MWVVFFKLTTIDCILIRNPLVNGFQQSKSTWAKSIVKRLLLKSKLCVLWKNGLYCIIWCCWVFSCWLFWLPRIHVQGVPQKCTLFWSLILITQFWCPSQNDFSQVEAKLQQFFWATWSLSNFTCCVSYQWHFHSGSTFRFGILFFCQRIYEPLSLNKQLTMTSQSLSNLTELLACGW